MRLEITWYTGSDGRLTATWRDYVGWRMEQPRNSSSLLDAEIARIYTPAHCVSKKTVTAGSESIHHNEAQTQGNEQKSAVVRPWKRKFLGFGFTANREPKPRNENRPARAPSHRGDEPIA